MASTQPSQGQPLPHPGARPAPPGNAARTDGQLLQRFACDHDEGAFAELVRRHGPLVLGICRRVLNHEHDADDAFQASFIVLARKASAVRWQDSVAGWLCRVAYRIALKARTTAARRRAHEKQAMPTSREHGISDGAATAGWHELRPVLDEELDRLPEKYRVPVVLCYLQNRTNDQVAAQLGCSRGTIASRLSRARDLLRHRLARRGVALPSALLVALLSQQAASAAVPTALLLTTVKGATLMAAGKVAAAGLISSQAATLADAGMKVVGVAKLQMTAAVLAAGLAIGAGVVALPRSDPAQMPPAVSVPLSAALSGHTGEVLAAAFSPDGKLVATAGADDTTRLWDVATRRERASLRGDGGWMTCVAFSPDGQLLAAGNWDFRVKVWDVATGKLRGTLLAHEGGVDAVVFTPDGQTLITAGGEHHDLSQPGEIKLWDPVTLQPRGALAGHKIWIHCLAISADGKTLASGSDDGTLKLWDMTTRQERFTSRGHRKSIHGVAFSPDGGTVATASKDTTLKLWDVATGKEKMTLRGHDNQIWSVAFSPDGRTLATGGDDFTIKLWDPATGNERTTLTGHRSWVSSLAFSPDSRTLVSTSWEDHAVRFWDVASAREKTKP